MVPRPSGGPEGIRTPTASLRRRCAPIITTGPLVERRGIEPRPVACHATVLPLAPSPRFDDTGPGLEPDPPLEEECYPIHQPGVACLTRCAPLVRRPPLLSPGPGARPRRSTRAGILRGFVPSRRRGRLAMQCPPLLNDDLIALGSRDVEQTHTCYMEQTYWLEHTQETHLPA